MKFLDRVHDLSGPDLQIFEHIFVVLFDTTWSVKKKSAESDYIFGLCIFAD